MNDVVVGISVTTFKMLEFAAVIIWTLFCLLVIVSPAIAAVWLIYLAYKKITKYRVIKQGERCCKDKKQKKSTVKFECENCGCIFETRQYWLEITKVGIVNGVIIGRNLPTFNCPNCGNVCKNEK